MGDIKSLKYLYGLKKDISGFKSSLVTWYNEVVEKTYADLDARDVSKMIRQNILREIALDKAIEILQADPFIGEMSDGDLLVTTVNDLDMVDINRNNNNEKLTSIVKISDDAISEFEWADDISKESFNESLTKLKDFLPIS